MPHARVFVPMPALETWLSDGRAEVDRDALVMDDLRFDMTSAVRFVAEVTGGPDELSLVGRVKSKAQLAAISAEHSGESVLLGDNAYFVVEGYMLSPRDVGPGNVYPRIIQLFSRP